MVLGLSNEMKVKVVSDKDCVQVITVEMPVDKVKERIEKAFVSVQNQAKVPGFRPGKGPIDLIRKNYADTAYGRAQDDLLREGVTEALKSKKIHAIQSPVIQSMEFAPDKPFQFQFQVEVAPKFKVTGHTGLKLTKTVKKISDEDVQKAVANLAEMNARLAESKAEAVRSTDFAVIDYEGFLDGKTIEGAKAQNFLIDMSAPQAIAGLAEGLAGTKVGEEKEIAVNFPEDSPSKELAGKSAVFKVKLNAIKEKQMPAIDDDFAKDMGLASLEELKTRIRENLQADADHAAKKELEQQVIDGLLKENEFTVPPSLIEEQLQHIKARQQSRLARQGVSADDQAKFVETNAAELKVQAEKEVRLAYVLGAIADQEKIDVTEGEVEARIKDLITKSDPRNRAAIEKALQGDLKAKIQNETRENKIFDWIVAHGKVKEVSGGAA